MIHIQGKVRDYNSSSDTCSVEFEGIGIIDTWFDGIKIDPAIFRAFLVHGAPVTLQAADEHRLDEAILIGVGDSPNAPNISSSGTVQTIQTGRATIPTDGTGSGSLIVSFPAAYTTIPADLRVKADDNIAHTISSITRLGFTITVSGGPINAYPQFTWQAQGN